MADQYTVGPETQGLRLDHFLVGIYSGRSRASLSQLIRSGNVLVNDRQVKAGYRLHPGERVSVDFPAPQSELPVARKIDFDLLYEDDSLLVVNKPAGLVVHPGDGNRNGTLVNGLLYRYPSLPAMESGRPGIVHRLDKDTSGVLLVARTEQALRTLSKGFRDRKIGKTYHALLLRKPPEKQGRLVAPIGRHPVNRKKMAIRQATGRYAATRWKILRCWPGFSLVEIDLETGRTHQIRVHMASLGCPVAGDALYGGRVRGNPDLIIERQLLHASTIVFAHPESGRKMCFTAPLPEDMKQVMIRLDNMNP